MKSRRMKTGTGSVLPRVVEEPEVTARETARPTDDVAVEGFCQQPPPPSTVRELNFDDVGSATWHLRSRGRPKGGAHHASKQALDALIQPPRDGIADFLLDPSLLPKRPPCAARPS